MALIAKLAVMARHVSGIPQTGKMIVVDVLVLIASARGYRETLMINFSHSCQGRPLLAKQC